jgi:hypothetical protein
MNKLRANNLVTIGLITAFLLSAHFSLLFAADTTGLRVVSHFVTSGESLTHAKRTPMRIFTSQDYLIFFVSLQWDPTKTSLGKHSVTWNWYAGDRLISTDTKPLEFHHPPYDLWSKRAASALGTGSFRVEARLDGRFLAGNTFTIKE